MVKATMFSCPVISTDEYINERLNDVLASVQANGARVIRVDVTACNYIQTFVVLYDEAAG